MQSVPHLGRSCTTHSVKKKSWAVTTRLARPTRKASWWECLAASRVPWYCNNPAVYAANMAINTFVPCRLSSTARDDIVGGPQQPVHCCEFRVSSVVTSYETYLLEMHTLRVPQTPAAHASKHMLRTESSSAVSLPTKQNDAKLVATEAVKRRTCPGMHSEQSKVKA